MPFTFAHPAAVVPLKKFCPRLNLPALIAGSITPDLGYYLHNWVWSISGHSFAGSVTFDIPAGLTLLALFYLTIRPMSRLLPYPHREACSAICPAIELPKISSILIAAFSVLVGAWTHIIWDGFTHANGWCVREVAALTPTLFTVYGYHVSVWQMLQHASSVFGLLVLAYAYNTYAYGKRFLKHKDFLGNKTRFTMLSVLLVSPAVYAITKNIGIMNAEFSIPRLDLFSFNATITYICVLLPLLALAGIAISLFEYVLSQFPQKENLPSSPSGISHTPPQLVLANRPAITAFSASADALLLPLDSSGSHALNVTE